MARQITHKEAFDRCKNLGLTMIGVYQKAQMPVMFECPFCKKRFIAKPMNIWNGDTKSCGCYRKEYMSKAKWRGTKDISSRYFNNLIKCAKNRKNIEFNITIDYMQELLEKQNYTCAFSGLPILCSRCTIKKSSTYSEQTASLDRIDNTKGYIPGNVQWVHKDINYMKQELSDEKFLNYCKLICQHRIRKEIFE